MVSGWRYAPAAVDDAERRELFRAGEGPLGENGTGIAEQVNPRDREIMFFVATAHLVEKVVEGLKSLGLDGNDRGRDGQELDVSVDDDAGQPHAPDCRPEQFTVASRGTG